MDRFGGRRRSFAWPSVALVAIDHFSSRGQPFQQQRLTIHKGKRGGMGKGKRGRRLHKTRTCTRRTIGEKMKKTKPKKYNIDQDLSFQHASNPLDFPNTPMKKI